MTPERNSLESQAERLAKVKLAQAAREQGIRAQAIKQGRHEREREILESLGKRALDDLGQLEELKRSHEGELQRAAHMIGGRSLWKGFAIGLCVSVFVGLMSGMGGYWIAREGMFALVAADRARAGARASDAGRLLNSYEPAPTEQYERSLREPGDAPRTTN